MLERHDVGRAERGGVGEAQIEVVEELGSPSRWSHSGVQLFGKRQIGKR